MNLPQHVFLRVFGERGGSRPVVFLNGQQESGRCRLLEIEPHLSAAVSFENVRTHIVRPDMVLLEDDMLGLNPDFIRRLGIRQDSSNETLLISSQHRHGNRYDNTEYDKQ